VLERVKPSPKVAATRLLLIEDNEDDQQLILRALRQLDFEARIVDSYQGMEEALAHNAWDLILCDFSLRTFNALHCLELYHRCGLDIPFILVSGTVGEETAVEVMRAGAHDYILKDRLNRLVPAIQRELKEAEIRKAHRAGAQAIYQMTHYDSVTNLPNREYLIEKMEKLDPADYPEGMGIILVEAENLMNLQRIFGYDAFNQAARTVADRLLTSSLNPLIMARTGDSDFCVILPSTGDPRSLSRVCNRILELFARPVKVGSSKIHIDLRMGHVVHRLGKDALDRSLQHAAFALQRSYLENSLFEGYSELHANQASELLLLLGDLASALDSGQVTLYYQPYVHLQGDRLTVDGVEGLVRWHHPRKGLLLPGQFLDMAEHSELIQPLTRRVIECAAQQQNEWMKTKWKPLEVSINLSVQNLPKKDLVDYIASKISEYGLSPEHWVFEVTESLFMHHFEESQHCLNALRDRGFCIVIDDFGTGYSSLSYLKRLPISRIKIDRTFIRNLPEDPVNQAIVSSLIDLSHRLRLEAVAEGVETKDQLTYLRALGCDKAQGYALTPPLPVLELQKWIRQFPGTLAGFK
jgi:EAL domain-containing protein (putative c-di-GMP-specific phosphodiesterase class I)/GGDEF domain-containing protein